MIVMNLGAASSATYVPNCAGTYNPCSEVEKAKSTGMQVPQSVAMKCQQFKSKCGRGADMASVKTSVTRFTAMKLVNPAGNSGVATQPSVEIPADAYPDPTTGETIDPTTGSTIDPVTGLPVEPWYMNRTYWLIGGAALVGMWLLKR
jgi:hypothetical protein